MQAAKYAFFQQFWLACTVHAEQQHINWSLNNHIDTQHIKCKYTLTDDMINTHTALVFMLQRVTNWTEQSSCMRERMVSVVIHDKPVWFYRNSSGCEWSETKTKKKSLWNNGVNSMIQVNELLSALSRVSFSCIRWINAVVFGLITWNKKNWKWYFMTTGSLPFSFITLKIYYILLN